MSELTPVDIERKLRECYSELTRAYQILAAARNAETDAEIALMRARDEASLVAPKVTRGQVTVTERDEIVDRAIRDEWEALTRAAGSRRNAEDYLRVVREQASLVQSLNASVRAAYAMAGAA